MQAAESHFSKTELNFDLKYREMLYSTGAKYFISVHWVVFHLRVGKSPP